MTRILIQRLRYAKALVDLHNDRLTDLSCDDASQAYSDYMEFAKDDLEYIQLHQKMLDNFGE